MATTALVAEILIVGLQAALWITLFVGWVVGSDLLPAVLPARYETLVVAGVLAAAYALGIIVDRVSDSMYEWLAKRLRRSKHGDGWPIAVMRLALMRTDDGVARFLEYQRSRMRIARATVFNLPIILVTGALFLQRRTGIEGATLAWLVASGAVLFFITVYASSRIRSAYAKRLTDAYRDLRVGSDSVQDARAAAVCYSHTKRPRAPWSPRVVWGRITRAGSDTYQTRTDWRNVELLLVRTKDGRHWTFPKGHVEPGEAPYEAAAREALEEAGVRGFVDPVPVRRYLYPSGGKPHVVDAYTLEIVDCGAPHEDREQVLCPPWEVRRRLAEGRTDDFTAEHHAVVAAALKRLGIHESDEDRQTVRHQR